MPMLPKDVIDTDFGYTVVPWPESQEYMDLPDVILITDPVPHGPSAYAVPKKYIGNTKLVNEELTSLKLFCISYRKQCYVEARTADEAMELFANGESFGHEYVEFMSIERKTT